MAVFAVPSVLGDHLVHTHTEGVPGPDDRDPLITRRKLSDQRKIIIRILLYKQILKLNFFYNSANIVVSLPKYSVV